jgi:hypothetical protein
MRKLVPRSRGRKVVGEEFVDLRASPQCSVGEGEEAIAEAEQARSELVSAL